MMTPEQFTQTLQTLLRSQPPQPFIVVLTSGQRFDIDDPHTIALSGTGRACLFDPQGNLVPFDHQTVSELIPKVPETTVDVMTPERFEQTLRSLLSRRPYRPITVVLRSGERFEIDDPQYVSRAGGSAGYIGPAEDLHFFDYEDVAEFIPASEGVAS
jgi:hypothetical protein